jgi:hypothetical protein
VDLLVVHEHAMGGFVHSQVAKAQCLDAIGSARGGFGDERVDDGPSRPEPRLNAQHELAHAERLDYVVVGTDLEPNHAIDFLGPGREDDDCGLVGAWRLANPAADLHARHVRQHQIEQDQIGMEGFQRSQGQFATVSDLDFVAAGAEGILQ